MKRTALAALAIAVLAASCGQPGSSAWPDPSSSTAACTAPVNARSLPTNPGHVTIGSADFPESEVLAVLYGQAMQAKGVTVNYHLDIG
ncbi:MAG: glycine/betaine ABC transporter, partial [Microlunatus sp.]|nr:glycine/betaine ABC transporter [Microlunatus sp.]